MSDRRFTGIAFVALSSLCVIVVTGALVRLTGSGLGCSDWPRCNTEKFVDVSDGHTMIEQLNRLFTGVVSVAVIAAVLSAHLVKPRRKDLLVLSWGLVVGVFAQVVIGGIVVLTGLNPYANMSHFLVSMILVTCAFALWRRSQLFAHQPLVRRPGNRVNRLLWAPVASGFVAVCTGTVVTGTGPHAGDENAIRFGFELVSVARVHSVSVLATVALLCWLGIIVAKEPSHRDLLGSLQSVIFLAVLQGAIGYTQYFTGVPVQLVALHIAGATAFVLGLAHLVLVPASQDLGVANV